MTQQGQPPGESPGQSNSKAPRLPPAYRLVVLDTVTSTNDEAKRLAAAGAEDGTLVWAREQSAGRGRHGRSWESPPGNLYMSLVARPECPMNEAMQLGFVAALAVGETLGSIVPPLTELRYKWPNDVLLNGSKVAGILMESATQSDGTLDWLILGLGINVASHPKEARFPATCLSSEGAETLQVGEILESFSRHFLTWVNRWLDGGFEPIRKAWLHYAYALDERIEVRLGEETVAGRFAELDADGALVLETDDGARRTLHFGDVFRADEPRGDGQYRPEGG
jgi:BirA family biotin operon repressor/biotin-[acetyl-CoA-carboxylase] ligase